MIIFIDQDNVQIFFTCHTIQLLSISGKNVRQAATGTMILAITKDLFACFRFVILFLTLNPKIRHRKLGSILFHGKM